MTKNRVRWTKGDEFNKWVTCLNCDFEYYIESFELNPCCPVCESKEYDEAEEYVEDLNFIGW
jgi:ssDNA-binding Zn-finger/Zn-ribbon topoisomerase 1